MGFHVDNVSVSGSLDCSPENECATVQEQKCEIQYMTQYEQQCATQNENVSAH